MSAVEKANFFRSFDGMCWPAPSENLAEVEWRARHHATPSKNDLMVMASVCAAYQELIRLPLRQRDKIIKELRKGPGIVRATQAAKQGGV